MKIPYGISDFGRLRSEGYFYADKTPFLPLLGSAAATYSYVLFLRPRRFGKSTLVSLIEHYYDQGSRDRFDELFKGLWIHDHPTADKNGYLVATLDFSPVNTDGGVDAIRQSFTTTVKNCLRPMLVRYREKLPDLARLEATLDAHQDATGLIGTLLSIVAGRLAHPAR